MNSRRGFLKTGLVLGGASLVGGGLVLNTIYQTRQISKQLVSFLDYPELARTVGQGWLDADQGLHNSSLGQTLDRVLQSMGISRTRLVKMTRQQLLDSLHQQVRNDFEDERIVLSRGWLLSKTEVQLCALLALLS